MKTMYHIRDGNYLSVLDVIETDYRLESTDVSDMRFVISRLSIPPQIRNRGYAKALLSAVAQDADSENVKLWLEVVPYSGTDENRLVGLYQSFGFQWHSEEFPGLMVRIPQLKS